MPHPADLHAGLVGGGGVDEARIAHAEGLRLTPTESFKILR